MAKSKETFPLLAGAQKYMLLLSRARRAKTREKGREYLEEALTTAKRYKIGVPKETIKNIRMNVNKLPKK